MTVATGSADPSASWHARRGCKNVTSVSVRVSRPPVAPGSARIIRCSMGRRVHARWLLTRIIESAEREREREREGERTRSIRKRGGHAREPYGAKSTASRPPSSGPHRHPRRGRPARFRIITLPLARLGRSEPRGVAGDSPCIMTSSERAPLSLLLSLFLCMCWIKI
jgi:hypothetical protein